MKILNAQQVREWDAYTIAHQKISSLELMERAALTCTNWLIQHFRPDQSFIVFCGMGNNGGDGLAIARILTDQHYSVVVFVLEEGKPSKEFQSNYERLNKSGIKISAIQSENDFPLISPGTVLIDCLFGTGLNRPLENLAANLVDHINNSHAYTISIDLPGGLFADISSKHNPIVKANHTLTFQCLKPAFLMAENADFIGDVHILDIGLDPSFPDKIDSPFELVDEYLIRQIYRAPARFSHKGDNGHALLLAGSYGKMGAAILSARASLRSGLGLLSCHIPGCGYSIMQTAVPEAMVITDFNSSFITKPDLTGKHNVIGIGPGIGTASETRGAVQQIFNQSTQPLVIDADALNIISMQKDLLNAVKGRAIITPHPKEFERLFGELPNDFSRIETAIRVAREYDLVIVLKGHYSLIATPSGKCYFNSTGNPGMATGGTGDVLTGILTGLVARNYSLENAAILGVYVHGLAGDFAVFDSSPEAMIASDITENLGKAFQTISGSGKVDKY